MKLHRPPIALLVAACSISAAPVDFNRDVRPILSQNCFLCHGPDEQERKGKLRLDIRDEALKAGSSGALAIVPGSPEKSELMARVTHSDPDEQMPPAKSGKKLSSAEINTLRTWIAEGAKYATHWAYSPPVRPALPGVSESSWTRNGIDYFIRQRLDQEKLAPQPEADRRTLVRRVYLDLTGLPPSREEVQAFLDDSSPTAYERMVDRALARESFGEHWARMWLDLARYADSAGYADDPLRTIWAYRDYVIKSFNDNKPFDQFTIEQIAGDLLPECGEEQLVATAFHRNTMTNNEGGTNDEEFRNAAVVDRVNTTMAVWMGTSMACAQCHTHKYDPITQEEYFQFFALLDNTEDADRPDESPTHKYFTRAQSISRGKLQQDMAPLEAKLTNFTPETSESFKSWSNGFPRVIAWNTPKPVSATFERQGALTLRNDSSVATAPATNVTFKVSLPVSGAALTALRLELLDRDKFAETKADSFALSKFSARILPPEGKKQSARFVRIELPGKEKILSLAEVEIISAGENIAKTGSPTQSSTDYSAEARLAIDGNTDGNFTARSTTHSSKSDDPWWELDLKELRDVQRVTVWNRTDNNLQERLNGFRVQLLDAERKVVWQQQPTEAPKTKLDLSVDGSVEVRFAGATATSADDRLKNADWKNTWAPASTDGQPALTLFASTRYELSDGSRLELSFEQQSATRSLPPLIFRVSIAGDGALPRYASLPSRILTLLSTGGGDAEPELGKYYLRHLAPQLESERTQLAALQKQHDEIKPFTVPILRELAGDKRRKTHFQYRGNFADLGKEVSEGVPAAFHPLPNVDGPKRLALAKWLVDRDNPLTARVTVNRFWEQIFGIGLVRTSEEFGSQGELPSHPELLDWLAVELMDQRWDVKAFLKTLVCSATYRQSSRVSPELAERDPDNRFLARGPRFRVSAESVRDQALFVAGLLSPKIYGPSVKPPRPSSGLSAAFGSSVDWKTSEGEDRYRRALYTEARRTAPYPSMATFDAPNREVCTIRRNRTNTPLQALVTMNDPVYLEAAQGLARRMHRSASDLPGRIRLGFELVLSRPPEEHELARLLELFAECNTQFGADKAAATKIATDPLGNLQDGQDVTEMAALTTVSSVLLNLDETVMKR